MPRNLLVLALCGLLLASAAPAHASIFDTIGGALSDAGGAIVGAGAAAVSGIQQAAGAVADTAVSGWEHVKGWSEAAWNKVTDTFVTAKDFVECKTLDWATVDLDTCWKAPPSNLCPAKCKENLDKFPDACLNRIIRDVEGQGNQAAIDRLQQQFTACGRTGLAFGAAAAGSEAPFGITSADTACSGVDWMAVNSTSCEAALDASDVACPKECAALLAAVPAPCLSAIGANATALATEAEQMVQLFQELCKNATAAAA